MNSVPKQKWNTPFPKQKAGFRRSTWKGLCSAVLPNRCVPRGNDTRYNRLRLPSKGLGTEGGDRSSEAILCALGGIREGLAEPKVARWQDNRFRKHLFPAILEQIFTI
jgi:hypothetical protein